jgi:dTMP kinase
MTGRIQTDDRTIAGLFVADRLDHLYNPVNGLINKINDGITVISDRYYFSSYAYHGAHMDMNWVIEANKLSAEALRPDINIYIDVEPLESLNRLSKRSNTERYEKLDNMIAVREKYFEAFEKLKDVERVIIIQSQPDAQETATKVKEVVDDLFGFGKNQNGGTNEKTQI